MPINKGTQTIFWWIIWITATIASFFIAAAIWTPIIANRFGNIYEARAGVFWVITVFGTWMIFLVPLIVFMYQKVDKAYEDARINREKAALRFRSLDINIEKRRLKPDLAKKLAGHPETIKGGHLVTVELQNGQAYENVFIQNQNEILGIYDQKEMPFEGSEVVNLKLTEKFSNFSQNRWLRLDGASLPE